ncbi:MAG: formylglycine-generating enzyme family protein [Cytophagales bacterium]|nr:formylglycine-generating enzyme family protein [Cytophagales bacterium]
MYKLITLALSAFLIYPYPSFAQGLRSIFLESTGNWLVKQLIDTSGNIYNSPYALPLVSFDLCPVNMPEQNETYTTSGSDFKDKTVAKKVKLNWQPDKKYSPGIRGTIIFENVSKDTLWLTNVVPLGKSPNHVYITGLGDHGLSRTHIFRPGKDPVNCIVPDNAWELGYAGIEVGEVGVCALVRRDVKSIEKGIRRRFETELYPGGKVKYTLYADLYRGNWQEGLRLIFQHRHLYDVEPGTFDSSLYQREDLRWIRHAYASHLIMAWDNYYYDYVNEQFHLTDFEKRNSKWFGGDDFIGIWPTWPTLGIDRRNQWDLFRDLPDGIKAINDQRKALNELGAKLFICYNPWDESTRRESHTAGMSEVIRETGADGVVLDTKGESSKELQNAADSVREGVIMYSEGMAVPKNMQGIVSGRVHNALYYCPMLNLNKFIKPEFAIFRVAELYKEPIRREYALSFFNGYGTEMNIFAPGKPPWADEQYKFWGRTLKILRENTHNFVSKDYTPLIDTGYENIWVNKWPGRQKTIYTVYSLIPEGFKDHLFEVYPKEGYHFVDIWHHNELEPEKINGKWMITAETSAFDKMDLGTNNEGAVDCIVRFPAILQISLFSDELTVGLDKGDGIKVWAGKPDYEKKPLLLPAGKHSFRLSEYFGRYEGKFVIQAFADAILLDERVIQIKPGTPRLKSEVKKTDLAYKTPEGMVKIPAGGFTFWGKHGDEFIPYPKDNIGKEYAMPAFFMDRYPVTNRQYRSFLEASNYKPADTANFLKHWKNGRIKAGEENFPVVYISLEDAKAYAAWTGKRLPTEVEWQYAAQTSALNEWPWEQENPVTRKKTAVTNTLSVFEIDGIDQDRCNLGNGELYAVGKYPKGANPYDLMDLVGCVWQLTDDEYFSGSYRYIIIKGGSYFKPSSSWWYVQGGPRELNYRQQLLRVSQGFERNSTVGFRCVKDAE